VREKPNFVPSNYVALRAFTLKPPKVIHRSMRPCAISAYKPNVACQFGDGQEWENVNWAAGVKHKETEYVEQQQNDEY